MNRGGKQISFLCQRMFSVFFLLFFILVECQPAAENILSIPGKRGVPYFDPQGNLNIVYINLEGGMSLARLPKTNRIKNFSTSEIKYDNNIHSISIKKNRSGDIWLVWEERKSQNSNIYIAQLKNQGIGKHINVTTGLEGFNFSPSMDFSYGNDLWVTWVNYSQKKYTIMVKNVTEDQSWTINSAPDASSLTPRIIIDGTEKIWIFWAGQSRHRDEILYSSFDGVRWRKSKSLNKHPEAPHVTPAVSVDFNGFPHVVWSAYDGDDYEIYYSRWDGNTWTPEKNITQNQGRSDIHPSVCMLWDTIPIVAWSSSVDGQCNVSLSYRMDDEWNPEIIISGEESITNAPKLISSGEMIGISWQVHQEIKIGLINFLELYGRFVPESKSIDYSRILALERDKYVGFGDSITFGIINNSPASEKGYIPRLEKLIDENIEDSQVLNFGVGGEETAEGLSRFNNVLNEAQARTIFLMEGTNDVKNTDISTDTAAFNLEEMAKRAIEFGMSVFLASIIPMDDIWDGLWEERTLDLNEKIKSIAAELNINFVDQFQAFGGVFSGPLYYSDATHPNELGYQIMAETFYEALVSTLPSIEVDKTSLLFIAKINEPNPPPQTFSIKNAGAGVLQYQISDNQDWISVSSSSGESSGEMDDIEVAVDISILPPGNYQGEITIAADYTPNSPTAISVQLSISSPIIEVDATSLAFEASVEEGSPAPKTLRIRNRGVETLEYQISKNKKWITVFPTSGDSSGEWDEIEVSVDTSKLLRGSYQGKLTITADDVPNSPLVIMVELTVLGPYIQVDRPSLLFEGVKGESNPASQVFKVKNAGEGNLNYQIVTNKSWIQVSPTSGASTGEWDKIKVSVDLSLLSAGTFQGKIRIQGENAPNSPQVLTITLNILGPIIKLNKSSLNFEATAGGSNPSVQQFSIRNSGLGILRYQITANKAWINVTPTSGTSSGERDQIQVAVDISNLMAETSEGEVIVRDENASNSPQRLKIFLRLQIPLLFSPLNFKAEKKTNRSLSQQEYINVLDWEANPKNKFVVRYKIYLVEGERTTLLTVVDGQTFVYLHRKIDRDKVYRYGLTAVDAYGRESEPTYTGVE